jgi:hypothetical protein
MDHPVRQLAHGRVSDSSHGRLRLCQFIFVGGQHTFRCSKCGRLIHTTMPIEDVRFECHGSGLPGKPATWNNLPCPRPTRITPKVRHLIYHLYPVRGKWEWHVEWLRRYWHVFNGRKIVGIAVDGETECESEVVKSLPADAERLLVINDPTQREAKTFIKAIRQFTSAAADETVCFMHSKGVRHPENHLAWLWAEVQYHHCLHRWKAAMRALRTHIFAGPILRPGAGLDQQSIYLWPWHFTGAFYWFRLKETLEHPRRWQLPIVWWYVEGWPAQFGPERIAQALLWHGEVNLYSKAAWPPLLERHARMGGRLVESLDQFVEGGTWPWPHLPADAIPCAHTLASSHG